MLRDDVDNVDLFLLNLKQYLTDRGYTDEHAFATWDNSFFAEIILFWITDYTNKYVRPEDSGLNSVFQSREEAIAVFEEMASGFDLYIKNEIRDSMDPRFQRSFELLAKYFGTMWD